jgi:hypothetical protein
MFGLVVMEVMTLSGHLSNINEIYIYSAKKLKNESQNNFDYIFKLKFNFIPKFSIQIQPHNQISIQISNFKFPTTFQVNKKVNKKVNIKK